MVQRLRLPVFLNRMAGIDFFSKNVNLYIVEVQVNHAYSKGAKKNSWVVILIALLVYRLTGKGTRKSIRRFKCQSRKGNF